MYGPVQSLDAGLPAPTPMEYAIAHQILRSEAPSRCAISLRSIPTLPVYGSRSVRPVRRPAPAAAALCTRPDASCAAALGALTSSLAFLPPGSRYVLTYRFIQGRGPDPSLDRPLFTAPSPETAMQTTRGYLFPAKLPLTAAAWLCTRFVPHPTSPPPRRYSEFELAINTSSVIFPGPLTVANGHIIMHCIALGACLQAAASASAAHSRALQASSGTSTALRIPSLCTVRVLQSLHNVSVLRHMPATKYVVAGPSSTRHMS